MSTKETASRAVSYSYLDGLRIKLESIFVNQEFLNVFALIALKLDHLAHLTIVDDGAIAS